MSSLFEIDKAQFLFLFLQFFNVNWIDNFVFIYLTKKIVDD